MESDLIGRKLGPFEILELVGYDGLIEVYRGVETQQKLPVKIKIGARSEETDAVFNTRFRRDARTIAGLRHPNIARLLDFGQAEGGHYMVMEEVEGVTLAALLEEVRAGERILEPADVAFVIRQVAGALEHAHKNGVAHFDLRPEHVILTRSGQAIVTDFGLALLHSQVDIEEAGIPTDYLAPEQLADPRTAGPASDVYALGVLLYLIVTGELPFNSDSDVDYALRHLNETAPDPRFLNPSVSDSIAAVILKALAHSPGQRFRTAMQLATTLERAYAHPDLGEAILESSKKAHHTTTLEEPPAAAPPIRRVETPEERREKRRLQAEHNRIKRAETWARRRVWWQGFRLKWGRTMVAMGIGLLLLIAVAYLLQTVGVLHIAIVLPTLPPPKSQAAAEPSNTPLPAATNTYVPTPTERPTATPLQPAEGTPIPAIAFAPLDVGSTAFRLVDAQVMVFVPAGQFLMGTDKLDRSVNSRPQHPVTLGDYWIDKTEVTNDQYRLCVNARACNPPKAPPFTVVPFERPIYGDFPVTYVSYEASVAYCLWAASQTGQVIGLPTEAQWEKTAGWDPSTSTQRDWPWGNTLPNPTLLRFVESPANRPATPVGSYPKGASAYGALDMAGNVWEWTADWFDENYYRRTGVSLDPAGPITGVTRVTRGGSWAREGRLAVTTVRNPVRPATASNEIGFRCAMTAGRPPAESHIDLTPLDLIREYQALIEAAKSGTGNDAATLDEWIESLKSLQEALAGVDHVGAVNLIRERLDRLDTQRTNGQIAESLAVQFENGLNWIQDQLGVPTATATP